MPTEMSLWRIDREKPVPIQQGKLDLEGRIENWIRDDVGLVNGDLLVIGQQVPTGFGGFVDLLAIDHDGNLVILELKRDRTPRDIVAQALDYASWVKELKLDEIRSIASEFLGSRTLEQAFSEKFRAELPEVVNERHRMYVVASSLDPATERIIEYLSESYNVDINAATFAYFKTQDGEFLGRSLLLADDQVQMRAERTSKRQPPLTLEQIRELAVERGVVEMYDKALQGLRPLYDHCEPTRQNVALVGLMGANKSRNVIMGIWPKDSSPQDGLALVIRTERVSEYFDVTESDLKALIGSPAPRAKTGSVDDVYLFDDNRLAALIGFLTRARSKPR